MKIIDSLVVFIGRKIAFPIADRITDQMLLISRHSGWSACIPVSTYLTSLMTFCIVFGIPIIWAVCRNLEIEEDTYDSRPEESSCNWRSEGF